MYGAGAAFIQEHRVSLEKSLIARSTRNGSQWSSTDVNGAMVYNTTTDSVVLKIDGVTAPTSYSIMVTDKAGNASANTIRTDASGFITLTLDNERQTPQGEIEEGSYELEINGATVTMLA
ncbi:MAG: hypothetical protein K6E57_06325, partial [Fibrobacter sp.]|nr:hypothetical protein [Fibrobacter sp.]